MEERATEDKDVADARDKTRAQLHRAEKVTMQIRSEEDVSDIPPHLLGA
jgi:hypothetical protein